MVIVPPLVVDNRLDGPSFFESGDAVTAHLEEWYVTDEDWDAYDSEGRAVELVAEKRGVIARPVEAEPTHESNCGPRS